MYRETAGHAEVHEQNFAARQVGEQILSPPLQPLDLAAAQARREVFGQGEPEVGPVLLNAGKHLALKRRLQAAPNNFDFG